MISNSVIKVLVNGKLSSPFDAKVGVPQGDPFSPALFNVYINSTTSICGAYNGIDVYGTTIHMLLYADDILLVATSKKDMQKALRSLNSELKKLGLTLSLNKCKLFALNAKSTISRCQINLNNTTFVSSDCLDYLGGTCKFVKKDRTTWFSDEAINKAKSRLDKCKSQHLQLNTITTTSMSKVVSLPRYACAFNGVEQKKLICLDIGLAEHFRKAIGLDNLVSKAVIYSSKIDGGLGITKPSALYIIEPICSALRMFNSTSSTTKQVALAAWNNNINDSYWMLVKNTINSYKWKLTQLGEEYVFTNEFDIPICPRSDILTKERSLYTINKGQGCLDKQSTWNPISTSFWNNHKLTPFHQRLLFAHLHRSEILTSRGGKSKQFPRCHICNTTATWDHVFTSCSMCTPELKLLYKKWDDLSLSNNQPFVRLPPDHSPIYINMDWNGIIHNSPLLRNHNTLTEWRTNIFCAFASYVGSCYKNSTWNSSPHLREKRGYKIKPSTNSYQTAWDVVNDQNRPGNLTPTHLNTN
jgi:hypothetical protein